MTIANFGANVTQLYRVSLKPKYFASDSHTDKLVSIHTEGF